MRIKHAEENVVFFCPLCKCTCGQSCTLQEHYQNVHKQTITADFAKFFAEPRPKDTMMRVPKQKVVRKPMYCQYCGERCSGSSNLNRHVRNQHPANEIKWKKKLAANYNQAKIKNRVRFQKSSLHEVQLIRMNQVFSSLAPRNCYLI